jgi:hypothetical protein
VELRQDVLVVGDLLDRLRLSLPGILVAPCPGVEILARADGAANPGGTTAMWVRDRLDGLWGDEDFADGIPGTGGQGSRLRSWRR